MITEITPNGLEEAILQEKGNILLSAERTDEEPVITIFWLPECQPEDIPILIHCDGTIMMDDPIIHECEHVIKLFLEPNEENDLPEEQASQASIAVAITSNALDIPIDEEHVVPGVGFDAEFCGRPYIEIIRESAEEYLGTGW